MRITRTYLAVPAHRASMVEKAAQSSADAVFLDLEDAVPPAAKAEALAAAIAALAQLDWGKKTVSVRINTIASGLAAHEAATLSTARRLDALIIPKAEHAIHIRQVSEFLNAHDPGQRIELEALIETAAGLVNVDSIAATGGRLRALHFGVGDFAASIGARSTEVGESPPAYAHPAKQADGTYQTTALDLWAYPMMRILVAARACSLRAIDGPCGAFRDLALTSGLAQKAAAMGFDGKQVIHPGQLDPTRAAFIPSAAEVEFAARVVAAMHDAQKTGVGAVSVDGKMIDYANLRMAERILAMAAAP
ncbi:MAG: CoA ester lyase [Acidocella sp.]|nr:CoA ester lyase [Acidocella sp.]